MKRSICILFLCLLPAILSAQQVNIDSLVNVLATGKAGLTDSEKIDLYWEISRFYSNYDYDKCIEFSKEGLLLAEKRGDKRRIATFNNVLGISYYYKDSFDLSLVHLNRYLETAIEIGDKSLEEGAYGNIGNMYKMKEEYPTAVEYYVRALGVRDTISRTKANTFVNLGTVHRALHHWDRAIEYLERAISMAGELGLDEVRMGASHALGTVYSDKEDMDKAIDFFEQSLELSRKLSNIQYELTSIQSLSLAYFDTGREDLSFEYGLEAVEIAGRLGIDKFVKSSFISLSELYKKARRYKECKEMAYKAWGMDSTSLADAGYAALNLAVSNIYLGEKEEAEYFLLKFQDIVFKGNDEQMRQALAGMEVRYETEKKEIRIAALEGERKLYIGLGISVFAAFALGIGFLTYRHRLSTQKRKAAEQHIIHLEREKELVATRSALEAEKAEREIIARDLHDGVGAMLSVVKNNMSLAKSHMAEDGKEAADKAIEGLDKSIAELRRVAHHIMPAILIEKGLAAALDDFCRSIPEADFHHAGPDIRLDPERELVLYRCAYELVSNAIRHAGASHIDVHLSIDDTTAYLSVVDNGCGFDPQTVPMGMGLKNMRKRLSTFGGQIEIHSNDGTETTIDLPIW
ncbi:MAG: sensor histidine kinase [Tannerellaceae bacterium]|jgi:signal transduction histidine kinase|nr:sensor histidine kinase [Tannerellaceae bacterium]